MTRLLTIDEVRERVPLSRDAIYRAIRRGDLAAVRIGGRLLVEPTAVEAWLDANRVRAAARELPTAPVPAPVVPAGTGSLRAVNRRLFVGMDG